MVLILLYWLVPRNQERKREHPKKRWKLQMHWERGEFLLICGIYELIYIVYIYVALREIGAAFRLLMNLIM